MMAYGIDWSVLAQRPDIGQAFRQGFDRGRTRSALGTLARDPGNPDALATLYQVDPASAARMESVGRERVQWTQQQDALAAQRNYITSRYGGGATATATPNALSGASTSPTPPGKDVTIGAGHTAPPTQTLDALAPASSPSPILAAPAAPPSSPPGGDRDAAWLAYAQADPAGAMKARQDEMEWQSSRLKLRKAELEEHQTVNTEAMRLLNGVTDQASYDRARADAEQLYATYGYDFPDLPAEYHPELVNALRARSLEMKDAIAADLAERKFGWQQQDDRLDNARADRSEGRQEYYRARSDRRAERSDRRSAVRFSERALDRAAMSGVRTDTNDLDY